MSIIRLMIVEDDPVWMKCLCNYIENESDLKVVKQIYTKEEALNVDCNNIDVVLLDLSLSENDHRLSGLEIINKLLTKGLQKIIMLTSWYDEEIILEAFEKGAINYVTKLSYRDIPKVIREAYSGKVSLHSDVSTVLINKIKTDRKIKVLTPAEREVYKLKAQGLSKNQIAEKLFKSIETIKKQLKMINKKLE
ncbi:response regulator transcription factor [Bacillus sp. BRMEA1]|uniref:response regulator n=1 Tax=Neobacillus endophyticus TaxID=2738405 RepID=UPI001563A8E1|nr:response regulator transcription factor [Neobacillus endophyticus]NRD77009.1 response regulator transcription factor [Neobacillus endophyticus]